MQAVRRSKTNRAKWRKSGIVITNRTTNGTGEVNYTTTRLTPAKNPIHLQASKRLLLYKLLYILLFSIITTASFAQQPAYIVLGENQLKGIQIYDLIQDNEKNYWIASNEGIFRYNFTSFEKVSCKDARSNSAFNFVKSADGLIYCHNLNNQVFKIEKGVCTLFYELSSHEGGSDVALAIAHDGNLLVSSRQIVLLNKAGKVVNRKEMPRNYFGQPYQAKDGSTWYHLNDSDSILRYANGRFTIERMAQRAGVLRFVHANEKTMAIDLTTKELYAVDESNYGLSNMTINPSLKRSPSLRLYETPNGFWIAGTLPGVLFMGNSLQNTNASVFFDDYFISDVYQDHEGNTLLSTFDKGILVVPDLKIKDVVGDFKDNPVTTLLCQSDGSLFIGTSDGRVLLLKNNTFKQLNTDGRRPIEALAQSDELLIFDDGHIRVYNKNTERLIDVLHASLKSAVYAGNGSFLLGTNKGLVELQWGSNDQFVLKYIDQLKTRVHRMAYDDEEKLLYVSSAEGLLTYDRNGSVRKFTFKGKELFPNDLYVNRGILYLVDRERGVLLFKEGKFLRSIVPIIENKPLQLKRLRIHHDKIIVSSLSGLFELDMNGKLLRPIHAMGGFSSERIIDFAISGNHLWVSHSGGIQKIDTDKFHQSLGRITLCLKNIRVNGKKRRIAKNLILASNQRKIQFEFNVPSLRNRELIRYHYRLVGADDTWNINSFDHNKVTYNALSPGVYEFQVKAELQGKYSQPIVIRFQVKAPFYLSWWFFMLCGFILFGLIFLVYRRKLRIQKKQAKLINELQASKLTAIQSQMNPHFIFNSLNSIQDLILKGDVEHSYSYITTFSDLVRRTLNYSEKDFIDFEQEIKLLDLYLSLEKLRFKKDFNYTIDYQMVDDLMIPPLMIQPFVENALVHGLLHKKGEKVLSINLRYDEKLICTIEDNGIGRVAARQMRQRQRKDHESFSGEAIRKRFEILSEVFGGSFGYEYEDLEVEGVACGTRVTLYIPVQPKF